MSTNAVGTRHVVAMAAKLEAADAPAGAGEISKLPVWSDGGQSHGLWQMTPGRLEGVQGPESVCIVAGCASVVVHPSGERVELQAGDVFVIDHDESADWTVTETVRKFYVVNR